MGDRVEALEKQMENVTTTLQGLALHMQQQSVLLTELSKQTGKRTLEAEPSVGDLSKNESRLAGKKVKLPLFEGGEPVAWITRAEIYFDVQNTSDARRVKLARLSMEGATIHWFNLLMETEDDLSWEKLKKSLIARYGGRRLENPFEELSTLRQTGNMEEYVEVFELLSSQVGRLSEEQYLGYFMSGLKPPIRRRVRTLNPVTRMQIMRIAKDVENELNEEDEDGERSYRKKQGELPKELEVVGTDDIYPDKVLGTRLTVQAGVTVPQSLIQWKNKSLDDVTWEDDAYLRGQFPEFSLEDKAGFKEGGVDRDMDDEVGLNYGPRVYTRRRGQGVKE